MIYVDEEIQSKAWEIAIKYRDKDFSFTDCASFAVMEMLDIREAFAFDKHFEQYGFIFSP